MPDFPLEVLFRDQDITRFATETIQSMRGLKQSTKYVSLLSAIIFADVQDHFEQQQGPTGTWKAWSKIYSDHMAKIGKGGNKILKDKGTLRQNFIPSKNKITDDSIVWFNNAKTKAGFPYAAAHNEGGPKLPQREFMWASAKALDKIADVTAKFLADGGDK